MAELPDYRFMVFTAVVVDERGTEFVELRHSPGSMLIQTKWIARVVETEVSARLKCRQAHCAEWSSGTAGGAKGYNKLRSLLKAAPNSSQS